jgi:hypothetical protein
MLTQDDLKAIVDTISPLIDARAKTTETLLKGEIQSVRDEMRASEERIKKELRTEIVASEERTKEELRAEIVAARAEAKATTLSIDAKLVKRVNSHETRIDELEKETGLPNPHKN